MTQYQNVPPTTPAIDFNPKFRRLIATWKRGADPSQTAPSLIEWSDGAPATIADFRRHQVDTHCFRQNDSGEIEQHICPDITATVEFDEDLNDWVVRGNGVETGLLGLPHPDASDDAVLSLVYTRDIVYKATLVRREACVSRRTN
jgi:hypothetical protein